MFMHRSFGQSGGSYISFSMGLDRRKEIYPAPFPNNELNQLTDVINIEVFLEGELPANFKRLKMAIRETLEQFVFYGGYRIQFRFSDPALAVGAKARNEYYRSLMGKGILPSNVSYSKNGQKTERLYFRSINHFSRSRIGNSTFG